MKLTYGQELTTLEETKKSLQQAIADSKDIHQTREEQWIKQEEEWGKREAQFKSLSDQWSQKLEKIRSERDTVIGQGKLLESQIEVLGKELEEKGKSLDAVQLGSEGLQARIATLENQLATSNAKHKPFEFQAYGEGGRLGVGKEAERKSRLLRHQKPEFNENLMGNQKPGNDGAEVDVRRLSQICTGALANITRRQLTGGTALERIKPRQFASGSKGILPNTGQQT